MSLATDVQRIEIMALKEMLSKKDEEIARLKDNIKKNDNEIDGTKSIIREKNYQLTQLRIEWGVLATHKMELKEKLNASEEKSSNAHNVIKRLHELINDMYVKRDNDRDKIQELQDKISMLESTVNVQNFAIIVKNRIIEMHRERDRGLPIPHVAIFLDDDCERPENAEVHDHA